MSSSASNTRPLGPRATRLAALLLFAGLATACGRSEPVSLLATPEDLPWALPDHLDRVTVEGLAAELAAGGALEEEERIWSVDFEDGRLAPLQPFAGFGAEAPEPYARLLRGEGAWQGGTSAALKGAPHGVSLRSPPIPVSPDRVYRLRYAIAVDNLRGGRGVARGGASLLLYALDAEQAPRAAELLADAKQEAALRVRTPRDFWIRTHQGSAPWTLEETRFSTGPRATHMVLSFDLSRRRDDRSSHQAVGRARYDAIELFARREPLGLRHRHHDHGAGPPHPLKLRVQLGHTAWAHANETRYALAAPAPSRLRFEARLSERPALSFGYGLLDEARLGEASPVHFSIWLRDARGRHHELFRNSLGARSRSRWHDVDLDLAAFGGQRVAIELRTEGRERPAELGAALRRRPEAGAVWSHPVLEDRGRRGKLIVLVGLDTLPAARSSTYGYPRTTTPTLSAIAERGLLFRRALSPSPWTLPAFASMLTGLAPARHRAGDLVPGGRQAWRALAPGFLTVAERLRQAGWETRAWINNPLMTRALGLDQGFVSYTDYATQGFDEAAEPGVSAALGYLARPLHRDRFVFLHMMDPHAPYRADDEFRERFVDPDYQGPYTEPLDHRDFDQLIRRGSPPEPAVQRRVIEFYDAALAYTDAQLARVFENLRDQEEGSEVALLVTSDHGEEFWEHGLLEHGHALSDELLRVPLVLYAPGRAAGGRVIDAPVSTEDIAATLLDLAGQPPPPPPAAPSLLGRQASVSEGKRLFVAENMLYGVERLAAERGTLRYVYNQLSSGNASPRAPRPSQRHELWELDDSAGEGQNRFGARLQEALELHQALAPRFLEAVAGSYALHLDAGPSGEPRRWEGTLSLPEGAAFSYFARDFVWPLPGGAPAPLAIERRRGRRELHFSLETSRALLAFPLDRGAGPLGVALRLDGEPLPPEQLLLGGAGETAGTGESPLPDAALWTTAEALLEPSRAGPRVRLGRLEPTPELRADDAEGRMDEKLRRELEALGYVQE